MMDTIKTWFMLHSYKTSAVVEVLDILDDLCQVTGLDANTILELVKEMM